MQQIKIKDLPCSYGLWQKIKVHAFGSLYRMNAKTADCYTFSIDDDGQDWEGGWDWINNLVSHNEVFLLELKTGKVFKI